MIPTYGSAYYQPRPDGEYDNHNYLVDPSRVSLERLLKSVVRLKSEFTLELEDGTQIPKIFTSSGVVIKGGIITIAHVVSVEKFFVQGPFGSIIPLPVKKVVEVKTSFNWGGNEHILDLLYVNKDDDVAFLGLPVGVNLPSLPIPVGNSDDLKIGNFIYVIGNPFAIYEDNIRTGIVSALQTPEGIVGNIKRESVFMITNGIIPGDSGGLVMAIRDGRYEFVGIGQGVSVAVSNLGWAIRINIIRDLIANECDKCLQETKDFFAKEGNSVFESQ